MVAPGLTPEQLAEVFIHEFVHYKDLETIKNHMEAISQVSKIKILPAKECLKKNPIEYCVETYGTQSVWFNIIALFYMEYRAFRTQILARNEGLKTNIIEINANGRSMELDLEILPTYLNEAYFKPKLGVALGLEVLNGLAKMVDSYPDLWSLYQSYFPELKSISNSLTLSGVR